MRDKFPVGKFAQEGRDELLDREFVVCVRKGEMDTAVFKAAELLEEDTHRRAVVEGGL